MKANTIDIDKMYLTNNSRRRAGLPLRRKSNAGKRYHTRCEAAETIAAFLDYCNGTPGATPYHR